MDRNDIIDAISAAISSAGSGSSPRTSPRAAVSSGSAVSFKAGFFARSAYNRSYTSLKGGRPFISEHDVRMMLRVNPSEISVPKNAVVSPLAEEIIQEKNVKINYV